MWSYGTELEWWEQILKPTSNGFLVLGIMLFILVVVFQGLHIFDHDVDHDVDHDISFDKDISLDHDVEGGIGHDDSATPLFLMAATFLLTFGGVGTIFFEMEMNSFLRLGFIISLPILTSLVVSYLWRKLAVSSLSEVAADRIKVDMEVRCITSVDEKGGLVHVRVGPPEDTIKMAARAHPGTIFKKREPGYVIGKEGGQLIIDKWPLPRK